MSRVSIKVDSKDAVSKLNHKNKRLMNLLVPLGLKNAAFHVHGEVKESIAGRRAEPTSVDTGRFLNSVDIKPLKDGAMIFSPLSYAKFLEFGTSRFSARHHFGNTEKRTRQKVRSLINNEVKKL